MKAALALFACLATVACTQQGRMVVAQSPQNIVLRRLNTVPLQTNFDFAAEHCQQYGREAQFQGTQPINIIVDDTFRCVITQPPAPARPAP